MFTHGRSVGQRGGRTCEQPARDPRKADADCRDTLAHVIFQGTAAGADGPPTTARLRAVLNRAARVVIVEGQVPSDEDDSTGAPRIDVTGADLADLAELLAIVDGGTGDRCRCNGWPTIMVHDAYGELIARWTLHHQTGIRGLGDGDADLRDGPALTAWLAEHGLTGSRRLRPSWRPRRPLPSGGGRAGYGPRRPD